MYGLLGRGNISHMPKMDFVKEVVNSFGEFFYSKGQTLCDGPDRLAATGGSQLAPKPARPNQLAPYLCQLTPTNSPHIYTNSPHIYANSPQTIRPTLYQLAPHLYQLAPRYPSHCNYRVQLLNIMQLFVYSRFS